MPWTVMHPAAPGGRAPGQDAGWLGQAFDPFHVDGDPNEAGFQVQGLDLPEGVSLPASGGSPHAARTARRYCGRCRNRAAIVGSSPGQSRLDALVSSEACEGRFRSTARIRGSAVTRYGRHIHGQCLLLARRLIEAGVGLVTVNWHNDGQFFWDTHGDNFNQLKNRLMLPPADQGFSALLEDLSACGLLEETLVIVWVGEFGRTPRINRSNSGREHWPHCYSAVLAGAGVRGGSIYGASDRWAAYPASDRVSPEDLGATITAVALGVSTRRNVRQGCH